MLNKLTPNAGAKLVIHKAENPPLPDEKGIDLQPNTETTVAIQKNTIKRLPDPYTSKCITSWNHTVYDVQTDLSYSLSICNKYCLQKEFVDNCRCFYADLVMPGIETRLGAPKACYLAKNDSTTNDTIEDSDYDCTQNVLAMVNNGTHTCNCPVSCEEVDFTTSMSISTWPSNQYWELLAKDLDYTFTDAKGPEGLMIKDNIQQDYLKMDIFYQTLNIKSIYQSPKYPESSLVSSLGGALSLYLGIAIIMCVELLELVFDLIINVWCHLAKKG